MKSSLSNATCPCLKNSTVPLKTCFCLNHGTEDYGQAASICHKHVGSVSCSCVCVHTFVYEHTCACMLTSHLYMYVAHSYANIHVHTVLYSHAFDNSAPTPEHTCVPAPPAGIQGPGPWVVATGRPGFVLMLAVEGKRKGSRDGDEVVRSGGGVGREGRQLAACSTKDQIFPGNTRAAPVLCPSSPVASSWFSWNKGCDKDPPVDGHTLPSPFSLAEEPLPCLLWKRETELWRWV